MCPTRGPHTTMPMSLWIEIVFILWMLLVVSLSNLPMLHCSTIFRKARIFVRYSGVFLSTLYHHSLSVCRIPRFSLSLSTHLLFLIFLVVAILLIMHYLIVLQKQRRLFEECSYYFFFFV